jgi:hypothetical protein
MTFVTASNWADAREALALVFDNQEQPEYGKALRAIPGDKNLSDALVARALRIKAKKGLPKLACTQDIGDNASCGDQAVAFRDLQPLCAKHVTVFDKQVAQAAKDAEAEAAQAKVAEKAAKDAEKAKAAAEKAEAKAAAKAAAPQKEAAAPKADSPANAALKELKAAVKADDKPRRNLALVAALDAGNDLAVLATFSKLSEASVLNYVRAARKQLANA